MLSHPKGEIGGISLIYMAIPEFFGLDLGHNSIKLAQLKRNGDKAQLVDIGSTPTLGGILDNNSEAGLSALSNELSKAHKASGINSKNCVVSVPEVSVFSRLLTLPIVKDEEVSESIHWALKPLIPVPLENVNVSFLQIDEKKVEDKSVANWYVVAAPKSLIDNLKIVMDKASLNLLAVETEALAIARMVAFSNSAIKDLMVLDFGAESSNIILVRNGVVVFSQSISTGSNALTKVIAADFGIDNVQAEKYKTSFGLDFSNGDGKIARSLEPIMKILVSEISRTYTYFKERVGGSEIKNLFLTGGGSLLPKLDEYLTKEVGIPTAIVNPLQNISLSGNVKKEVDQVNIHSYSVAIGLGLKSEND